MHVLMFLDALVAVGLIFLHTKKHASNTKIMFGFSPANLQQIRMEKDNQFSNLKSVIHANLHTI